MEYTAAPRENKEPPSPWKITNTGNLIRLLHRKDDAYVGFYTPDESKESGWGCIGGIRAENMREQFPRIAPEVIDQENIYFTVNGYWPGGRNEGKESIEYLGRSEMFLRSLNACYVDLDVNRLPLFEKPDEPEAWQTWRQAMATVGEMADQGEIPQPSIFTQSGRGLYVYWLLRDAENPEQPPPAFQLELYKRINRAIQERLRCVAPDPVAKDGARVLRVPNSKHANGSTVKYLTQHDAEGEVPAYTMGELAEWFEVEPVEKPRRRFDPNKVKGRRDGIEGLHRKRQRDLEKMFRSGNVRQGNRRECLTLYCYALKVLGNPKKEAAKHLGLMARKCSPPYPGADDTSPREIVDSVYRMKSVEVFVAAKRFHGKLAKRLGVSAAMAEELELETIVPDAVKDVRKERRRNAPTKAQKRQEWLVADVDRLTAILSGNASLRKLAEDATKAGHPCKHETIRRDLKQIHGSAGLN